VEAAAETEVEAAAETVATVTTNTESGFENDEDGGERCHSKIWI
jgi:hypothetical protein